MPLVEVVPNTTSTSAPGWAYIPEASLERNKLQPSGSRKRNARISGLVAAGDSLGKQNANLLKRLAELERDNSRDTNIAIPSKRDGSTRGKGKTTATRRILLAQKTFANYLADEEALNANEAAVSSNRAKAVTVAPGKVKDSASRLSAQGRQGEDDPQKQPASTQDSSHLTAADMHLLGTNIPEIPTEAQMKVLTSAQPLSFHAARAAPSSSSKPSRSFCELCGYWASAKCLLCGAKVCGLVCKRAHEEERCQKYGA